MDAKPEWHEISLVVKGDYADAAANYLMEQGSTGIVEEEVPEGVGHVRLTGYVADGDAARRIEETTRLYLQAVYREANCIDHEPAVTVKVLPEQDWNEKWKSFFSPVRVTARIVVKPSWKDYRPQKQELVIELDPGMAFGTGTHATTRMCLKAIEELSAKLHPLKDASLLDVGTGSGILAVAAALLGFGTVVGTDIDRQAVACAEKNAENNKVHTGVSFTTVSAGNVSGEFDLVVANILPHVLVRHADDLCARLAPGGFLVLSGILSARAGDVREAFTGRLFFVEELVEDEWSALVYENR